MSEQRSPVTARQIRQRFAGSVIPTDPTQGELPPGAERLPARWLEAMTGPLVAAAVLIPVIERPNGLQILFTERSADLNNHPGQVSFPGGRLESGDADIVHTALRETHEEVGIRPDQVEILGFLSPTITVTCYAVTPIVGFVDPAATLTLDPTEVESAFEVPLEFLLNETNQENSEREFAGCMVPVSSFYYGGHKIWGATAGMMIAFRNDLLGI